MYALIVFLMYVALIGTLALGTALNWSFWSLLGLGVIWFLCLGMISRMHKTENPEPRSLAEFLHGKADKSLQEAVNRRDNRQAQRG